MHKKKAQPLGISTRCVHAGETLDVQGGIHLPLYNHSTFGFKNTRSLLDVVEGRNPAGNLYTRYGLNPTIRGVEQKCASLEGGEACCVFGSGMAAEAATFLAHCDAGDHIICIGDVYGGTFELLKENLPTLGIKTTFMLGHELAGLPEQIKGIEHERLDNRQGSGCKRRGLLLSLGSHSSATRFHRRH